MAMNKGLTIRMGQTHVNRWTDDLLRPDRGGPDRPLLRHHPHVPLERDAPGIETVYQDLAVAPAMTVAENLFLGREPRRPGALGRVLRMIDRPRMVREAAAHLAALGVAVQAADRAVETLSGGQRQAVAVARAAAFARHVVILDEPTAALGVRERGMVVDLVRRVRDRGLAVVLVSHDMPQVFALADRIHVAGSAGARRCSTRAR
jgi:fructose transport system ATP-binding protein